MSDQPVGDAAGPDPYRDLDASPRFATPLAVTAIALGVVSVFGLTAPVTGPVGMGCGVVAHVKGSRLGMPAAGIAAVGMIVGMAVLMYLR